MLAWRGIQELQEHSAAILFDTNELMAIANVRSFRCILSKNGLQGLTMIAIFAKPLLLPCYPSSATVLLDSHAILPSKSPCRAPDRVSQPKQTKYLHRIGRNPDAGDCLTHSRFALKYSHNAAALRQCDSARKPSDSGTHNRNISGQIHVPLQDLLFEGDPHQA
jgi:hypothetical protein